VLPHISRLANSSNDPIQTFYTVYKTELTIESQPWISILTRLSNTKYITDPECVPHTPTQDSTVEYVRRR